MSLKWSKVAFSWGRKSHYKMGRKILLAPVCPAEPARVGEAVIWEKPPPRRLSITSWDARVQRSAVYPTAFGRKHALSPAPRKRWEAEFGGRKRGRRGGLRERAPAWLLSGWSGAGWVRRAGGREERLFPPGPQRAPPAQSPRGVQPGRPRGGAEGRRAGAGAGGGGCGCRGVWSAVRRLWLGRVAGVTAALAMKTLWMVLCALARLWPGALAGCAEAGRCCPGRDPACFARGWRLDRVYGTCFCDQACRLTGDCCFDYDRACPGGWLGPGWGRQQCNPRRRGEGRALGR